MTYLLPLIQYKCIAYRHWPVAATDSRLWNQRCHWHSPTRNSKRRTWSLYFSRGRNHCVGYHPPRHRNLQLWLFQQPYFPRFRRCFGLRFFQRPKTMHWFSGIGHNGSLKFPAYSATSLVCFFKIKSTIRGCSDALLYAWQVMFSTFLLRCVFFPNPTAAQQGLVPVGRRFLYPSLFFIKRHSSKWFCKRQYSFARHKAVLRYAKTFCNAQSGVVVCKIILQPA
jgi:hypothetical protein